MNTQNKSTPPVQFISFLIAKPGYGLWSLEHEQDKFQVPFLLPGEPASFERLQECASDVDAEYVSIWVNEARRHGLIPAFLAMDAKSSFVKTVTSDARLRSVLLLSPDAVPSIFSAALCHPDREWIERLQAALGESDSSGDIHFQFDLNMIPALQAYGRRMRQWLQEAVADLGKAEKRKAFPENRTYGPQDWIWLYLSKNEAVLLHKDCPLICINALRIGSKPKWRLSSDGLLGHLPELKGLSGYLGDTGNAITKYVTESNLNKFLVSGGNTPSVNDDSESDALGFEAFGKSVRKALCAGGAHAAGLTERMEVTKAIDSFWGHLVFDASIDGDTAILSVQATISCRTSPRFLIESGGRVLEENILESWDDPGGRYFSGVIKIDREIAQSKSDLSVRITDDVKAVTFFEIELWDSASSTPDAGV